MSTDRALIALPAGSALAGIATLLYGHPGVGLVGWLVCLVALSGLVRITQSFSSARLGAILGLVGAGFELGEFLEGLSGWLVLLGLLLLLTGGCAGMRDLLPEGTRRDAAGRISTAAGFTLLTLALILALDAAGIGTWAADLEPWLRGAGALVVAWFAAYVVLARAAVSRTAAR